MTSAPKHPAPFGRWSRRGFGRRGRSIRSLQHERRSKTSVSLLLCLVNYLSCHLHCSQRNNQLMTGGTGSVPRGRRKRRMCGSGLHRGVSEVSLRRRQDQLVDGIVDPSP